MSKGRPRRSKARRAAARHKGSAPRCPQPRKLAYASEEQALAALRYNHFGEGDTRSRPYRCGCGSWHLTSKKQSRESRGNGGST